MTSLGRKILNIERGEEKISLKENKYKNADSACRKK